MSGLIIFLLMLACGGLVCCILIYIDKITMLEIQLKEQEARLKAIEIGEAPEPFVAAPLNVKLGVPLPPQNETELHRWKQAKADNPHLFPPAPTLGSLPQYTSCIKKAIAASLHPELGVNEIAVPDLRREAAINRYKQLIGAAKR